MSYHRAPHAHPLALTLLLATVLPGALAQTPPDAGVLQQQIERELRQPLPPQQALPRLMPPEAMKPSGVTLTVREFRFTGNTLLSSDQLRLAVADYLDRPLDFSQLQAAAAAVANAYREAGWIVRAYLPRQDVKDGMVTIQIVEAVFGKLMLQGEATRVPSAVIEERFAVRQASGQPLNANVLDRALLLADDLPGASVAGTLRPGAREGETDLLLKLADEPLVTGDIGVDNTGARSTGEERLTANFALASPMKLGDQLSTNLIHSEGSDYLRASYSLPLGADGWRAGINASWLGYELVAPEFKALRAEGESTSFGLDASYPLIRARLRNLYFNVALDRKDFDNRSAAGTTSRYAMNDFTLGLSGNLFDNIGGGGANGASLALVLGDVELGAPDSSENAELEGRFAKVRASLSRQQIIAQDVSLYAAWSGQWTDGDLDSSEKFYLGGIGGVRAYPANEGGGARGQLLNVELRWKLAQGLSATLFRDWGRVRQNVDNAVPAAGPNRYSLKGHGLSLAWQAESGFNLKATWARREGDNPNPTATGRDQDGSLDKNRVWLSASLPF